MLAEQHYVQPLLGDMGMKETEHALRLSEDLSSALRPPYAGQSCEAPAILVGIQKYFCGIMDDF